jgi:hypothetical protein
MTVASIRIDGPRLGTERSVGVARFPPLHTAGTALDSFTVRRKPIQTPDVTIVPLPADYQMAGHQDARYIPPVRERDRSPPRRWRDRFPLRRLALTAVVMVIVVLMVFFLFYRRAS